MIIVKNRELLVPANERYLGTTYDNISENRQFLIKRRNQSGTDLSALNFRLDFLYANGNHAYDTITLVKEVYDDRIILTWPIRESILQVPGTVIVQIRAIDTENTVKWSTFQAAFYVERHLNTPGNYSGSLTEIEQMEQDFEYMKGVVDELKANIDYAHDAEAWAKGTRSGSAVPSTDDSYHNNSKYYSEQASTKATAAANSATAAANSATQAAETVADTNTRFNNAVAAVTSETEVIDARVGADGTQYTVLKARLDAEHTDVESAIRQVYNGDYTSALKGTQPVLLGNYSVGQTVDLSPMSTSGTAHYTLLIDAVSEGDVFNVNLTDGSTARPWAFLDASHKLLSMATGAFATNATLTAPANSAYLLLQCGSAYLANAKIIRGLSLRHLKDDIANEVSEVRKLIDDIVSVDVADLGFIAGGMDTNGGYQSNQKYRVVTQNKLSFPVDIRICLTSTAYRFYLIIFNADGTISKRIGWNALCCPFVITAGTVFKLMVSRVTEITSETNNVAEFSAITSVSILEDFESNALHNAIYTGDYTPLLRLSDAVPLSSYSVGQTVDLTPINDIEYSHLTTLIDNVIPGEKYFVNATDGNTARPWAFLDADFKLISMASTAYAQNVELTAPSNSHYLLIQVGTSNFPNAKINRLLSLDNSSGGGEVDTGIVALNARAALTEKLIETKYCGNNNQTNLMLLHFSDIHGSIDNITRILDLKEAYTDYVDDVIHSGDSVATYFGNDNPFATSGGNQVLNLIGNHDCWIQGDTWPSPYNATAQQTYEKFIEPFISSWGVTSPGTNLCYYYKDYADYSIRLICLDCMHYDSAQESWFTSALNGAKTNGYSVVVVNHYPPQSGVTPIDCTFTSYGKSLNSVATPPEGTQIERLPESAYTIVDEFMTGGGEFICWLAGHTHFDFVGTVTNHANQVVVIINCGVVDARYGTDKRVFGTKTQDCVNAIGFDTTNHIIKICRVGVSMDWFGRAKNLLSINYATRTLIANS